MKGRLTRDGPIAGSLLAAAPYGGIFVGIAWSSRAGTGWLIGSVVCGTLMASIVNPSHDVWLDGDVLVSRSRLLVRRLPWREVRSVYADRIPRGGDMLEVRGDDVRIGRWRLDDRSADLRRATGRLVPAAVATRGPERDLLVACGDH